MIPVRGYAAHTAGSPLAPFEFNRRTVGEHDVLIDILYCGVCHSDIHQVRDEWGRATYPMVPGHEIVGRVREVGRSVRRFSVDDIAGVGCFVDSCRVCHSCREGVEQYCERHISWTYNGTEQDQSTPTHGGYSSLIVVDEQYALIIPNSLDPKGAAPLLCAGITTYSPLRHWKAAKGQKIGVVGLGGLGHMAVKFAAAFGCEVTVFSTSPHKRADAERLGAGELVVSSDDATMEKLEGRFDLIIDTVSAHHDLPRLTQLLRRDGTLVLVGVSPQTLELSPPSIILKRRSIVGSVIGGIRETQEMLDYCGTHGIVSDIELIPMQQINAAYERVLRSDVRYRFVIDLKTL